MTTMKPIVCLPFCHWRMPNAAGLLLAISLMLVCATERQAIAATIGTGPGGGEFVDGTGLSTPLDLSGDLRDLVTRAVRDRGETGVARSVLPEALITFPNDTQLRALLAVARAADGDIDGARALLRADPQVPSVWRDATRVLIARDAGDLAAADRYIEAALSRDPGNAYVYNLAGSLAFQAGDLDAARVQFAKAVELGPDGAIFQANFAATLAALGDLGAARAILEDSHTRAPRACATRRVEANIALQANNFAAAEQALQICLQAQPENTWARSGLIEIALDRGDLPAATTLLNSNYAAETGAAFELARARIALFKGDAETALASLDAQDNVQSTATLAAIAETMRGDLSGAFARLAPVAVSPSGVILSAAFQAASGTPPSDRLHNSPATQFFDAVNPAATGDRFATLRAAQGFEQGFFTTGLDAAAATQRSDAGARDLALGVVWRLWGFHAASAEALSRASDRDPADPLAAYFSGLAQLRLGQVPAAEAAFARAIAAAPTFFSANVAGAELRMRAGAPKDAEVMLAAAVSVREDPGALIRLGLVQEVLGSDAAAQRSYERFVAVQPESYVGYNQLAWHLASRGQDLARANDLATRANELQPGNASILDTLGWIAFLRGDGTAALTHLRQARDITAGGVQGIIYHLAQAEIKFGNRDEGQQLLDKLRDDGFDVSGATQAN